MMKLIRVLALAALLIAGASAHAGVISFTITSDNNDCVGYYTPDGGSFEDCAVFAEDDPDKTAISSIIAKWDTEIKINDVNVDCDPNESTCWSLSSLYDSEFDDFEINQSSSSSGSWSYTGSDGIRFWVVKASTDFTVFYDTKNEDCLGGSLAANSLECMSSATVQTSGNFTTYMERGLSHISFYDSEIRVPEPGTLALLGLGLLGIGYRRSRQVRA